MATANSRLQITIEAKNNASPKLKGVAGDLKELDKAAGTASKGLEGLLGMAGVAGIGALAVGVGAATMELGRMAATAADVETSFKGMAGAGADQMFAGLKEASRGAISDMDLMLSANRAMLLGVADTTQEMTALMDVARARSQAMGTTTAEAFSDLVVGLGRSSTAILDNLGIMLDADTVNREYAESIGKTVSQLTDAEKKQALVNAVLRESADIVRANEAAGDDAASNYERMDAAIQNAKVALGELFSPAIVVVANALAEAATHATEAMQEAATSTPVGETGLYAAAAANAATNVETLGEATEGATKQVGGLFGWLVELSSVMGQAGRTGAMAAQSVDEVAGSAGAASAATQALTASAATLSQILLNMDSSALNAARGLEEATLMANLAQEAFAALRAESAGISNQIESAATAAGVLYGTKMGGEAGLSKQKAVTEELTEQRRLWREMGYTEKEINDVLLPGMVASLNEADRAIFSTAKGTARLSDEARDAQAAFSELESAVSGVLSGALDPGVGVDPDKLLEAMGFPREDTINENARRLADIAVKGLTGQEWLSEFQKEVPDIWNMIRLAQNPQEEAARLLKDFQDGLLTSPIDKAKAKEIVRRQILGDQNMAALATEIATELAAEMGIPLQQALAATKGAIGGGGGEEAAQNFSDAAAMGLEDAGGGTVFVDKFIEQMRARYSLLSTAGRDAGKMWGDGFLAVVGDHVPPGLISLLTELVTPGVMAKFAQTGTLTGATP